MMGVLSDFDLGEFEAITLDDLVAVADLQTRRDRKYVVPRSLLKYVLAEASDVRVLSIAERRAFAYESVYFDTDDHVSYLGAARRRPQRFKVRTRSYIDSFLCHLEVKVRDSRGCTVKHRQPYDFVERDRLTGAGRAFVATIAQAASVRDELQLALSTSYSRSTLVLGANEARVTIDVDLTWVDKAEQRIVLPDVALVETKTMGSPCAFDRALWRQGLRPTVISKYCTGLAALTPELPANKWTRVLRRHFDARPPRGQ